MARRAVGEQHQLVPPLRQGKKEREQNGQDQQPVADRHVDRDRASGRAQHEPDRDRQHVDDHDVLERPGVKRQQADVGRRDRGERRTQPPGARRAPRPSARPRGRARCAGETTPEAMGRKRLSRVLPVRLAIRDVVDEVDHAGQHAEDRERGSTIARWRGDRAAAGRTAARRTRTGSSSTATGAGTGTDQERAAGRGPSDDPPWGRRARQGLVMCCAPCAGLSRGGPCACPTYLKLLIASGSES